MKMMNLKDYFAFVGKI